jgi:hypothetical protein
MHHPSARDVSRKGIAAHGSPMETGKHTLHRFNGDVHNWQGTTPEPLMAIESGEADPSCAAGN